MSTEHGKSHSGAIGILNRQAVRRGDNAKAFRRMAVEPSDRRTIRGHAIDLGKRLKPVRGGSSSSPAWLLRGISSVPGELRLRSAQLSFVAEGRGSAWDWQLNKLAHTACDVDFFDKVRSGDRATLFNEPLAQVAVRFPWYTFSGGLIVTTRRQVYRLSFGQPASSSVTSDELGTVSTMRRVGKHWMWLLAGD
ncbi:MAG: hypothetical protein WBP11_13745 [Dokdonella sp.]